MQGLRKFCTLENSRIFHWIVFESILKWSRISRILEISFKYSRTYSRVLQNILELYGIFWNGQELAGTFENIPDHSRICYRIIQNIRKFSENSSEHSRRFWNILEHSRTSQIIKEIPRIFPNSRAVHNSLTRLQQRSRTARKSF